MIYPLWQQASCSHMAVFRVLYEVSLASFLLESRAVPLCQARSLLEQLTLVSQNRPTAG